MIEFIYYQNGKPPIDDDSNKLKELGGGVYETYLVFENREALIDS